jgi:hypothetical protein
VGHYSSNPVNTTPGCIPELTHKPGCLGICSSNFGNFGNPGDYGNLPGYDWALIMSLRRPRQIDNEEALYDYAIGALGFFILSPFR